MTAQEDRTPTEKRWLEITPRATGWAWGLCWLMFASTVLNYMNRMTITQVNRQISEAFGIPDQTQFGWVLAAFFMTYALFQVPAGFFVDRWDLRWSYAGAVIWWSTAAIATAVVPTLGLLIVFRALLGVGESFNWPCALRVTSRILPPQDRALGNGIFNSGAAVGAVATPLVIQWLSPSNWRVSFVVIGVAGYVWAAVWLLLVRGEPARMLARRDAEHVDQDPSSSTRNQLSPTARAAFTGAMIVAISVAASALWTKRPEAIWLGIAVGMLSPLAIAGMLPRHHFPASGLASNLADLVRLRRFWIMFVVSITINICWHFQVNWIPSYLKRRSPFQRVLRQLLGAVVIYLAADMGNLGGGWASRWLAAKGLSVVKARKVVLTCCMFMILSGPPAEPATERYIRDGHRLDHGCRNGRIYCELVLVLPGSEPAPYRPRDWLFGRLGQFIRGRLPAACRYVEGQHGQPFNEFLERRTAARCRSSRHSFGLERPQTEERRGIWRVHLRPDRAERSPRRRPDRAGRCRGFLGKLDNTSVFPSLEAHRNRSRPFSFRVGTETARLPNKVG